MVDPKPEPKPAAPLPPAPPDSGGMYTEDEH